MSEERCKVCEIVLKESEVDMCKECEEISKIQSHIKHETKKFVPRDTWNKDIKMTCSKCGKSSFVTTANLELYTEEVKKNWTCINCTPLKKIKLPLDCQGVPSDNTTGKIIIGEQNGTITKPSN